MSERPSYPPEDDLFKVSLTSETVLKLNFFLIQLSFLLELFKVDTSVNINKANATAFNTDVSFTTPDFLF